MSMMIVACEQGSTEWFRARMGLPTASEFAAILASGRSGAESKTRLTYMRKLAGEIVTGEPMDNFANMHMERGKAMEQEARDLYAFTADAEPERVGFIVNGRKGCSPDALVGIDGMLELKTKLPHLMIEILENDSFPAEHVAQCQGNLWIAEREWIDVAVYWPKLPLFMKRTYRDESYIGKLARAVDQFNDELQAMVERIRRYGEPEHPAPPTITHDALMKAVLEPLPAAKPGLDHTDVGGTPAFLRRPRAVAPATAEPAAEKVPARIRRNLERLRVPEFAPKDDPKPEPVPYWEAALAAE